MDSIIFDIDGTLLDSREQVRQAWSSLVEELSGHPWVISEEDFTALFGQPMDAIAKILFPEETDEEERMRKANLCYDAENRWLLDHPGKLFSGVRETLETLSKEYPLYIVSNCQKGYIEATLISTGLGQFFSGQLCFGDTGTPKGITIRRLMETHNLHAPVYVGDTQGDAEACQVAGIPFVYAEYGFGRAEKADYVIEEFSQLTQLFTQKEEP